jgi:hypothetical protein
LSNYPHLIAIDLSSYGSAFAIINQFCDDVQIKVFEVSPIGQAGLLILLVNEATAAEILKNEILSFYKSSVLAIEIIKNFHDKLLQTYLSQNKPQLLKSLVIQEFSFVSQALSAAHNILNESFELVDFRVVRTYPLNAVVVITSDNLEKFFKIKENSYIKSTTVIEKIENSVKNYFQIT